VTEIINQIEIQLCGYPCAICALQANITIILYLFGFSKSYSIGFLFQN